ncbi:MAG: hypothetical protein AAGM22_19735 [Acidobacteriota bacterium]
MTIQEFASSLASSTKNDLVEVVNQFRNADNMNVVLSTGELAKPWFTWGDGTEREALAPVGV